MKKIEVNAMTGMIDMMPEETGIAIAWGWTDWNGVDAKDAKLFEVYACGHGEAANRWYGVYVDENLHTKLPVDTDLNLWAKQQGWRPVINEQIKKT